ncbi:MAG: hypothetical protein WCB68_09030 [Pyrinomonadaceae bacterium]
MKEKLSVVRSPLSVALRFYNGQLITDKRQFFIHPSSFILPPSSLLFTARGGIL